MALRDQTKKLKKEKKRQTRLKQGSYDPLKRNGNAAYVFAGLGSVVYWPDPEIEMARPGDEYKTNTGITASIPLGAGVKYILNEK